MSSEVITPKHRPFSPRIRGEFTDDHVGEGFFNSSSFPPTCPRWVRGCSSLRIFQTFHRGETVPQGRSHRRATSNTPKHPEAKVDVRGVLRPSSEVHTVEELQIHRRSPPRSHRPSSGREGSHLDTPNTCVLTTTKPPTCPTWCAHFPPRSHDDIEVRIDEPRRSIEVSSYPRTSTLWRSLLLLSKTTGIYVILECHV